MNKFNLGRVRGDDGKSATIAIGTVKTGQAGSNANVENVGNSLRAIFDFTIPRGDKGDKGEKGDRGNEAYSAGTGIDITGDTISVKYGTAAGTAAQGNDGRLSDSREWTATTISQAEAEAGTATTRRAWTAQRVRQAINAWWQLVTSGFGRNFIAASNEQAARSVLQLGTAATRDVGTASGNVMEVGAFGVGEGRDLRRTVYTTGTPAELYGVGYVVGFTDGSLLSPPIGQADNYGTIEVKVTYSDDSGRVAYSRSFTTSGRVFIQQVVDANTWGAWHELISTGNILTTTGQSTQYPMTQKAVTDAINSATSATPVVVAANATVTLTNNQAVYAVNTAGAARTLTLPASPAAGARVTIIDYANTFQTNACTVARNGKNIEGAASNLSLHLRGQSITLLFIDNTAGWKIIAQSKQGGFA